MRCDNLRDAVRGNDGSSATSSGKTNLFRAIRLLLADNMIPFAKKLDETDFHRGLGQWQGHWIIISLEFEDVSQDESIQSLFLHANGNLHADFVAKATYNLVFRPKTEIRRKLAQLTPGDHDGLAELQRSITVEDYKVIFTGRSAQSRINPARLQG